MGNYIINTLTKEKINKPTPKDIEVVYDGKAMITETNLKGMITFANRKFVEMTGFTRSELIGSAHNINRHPDMPKTAFKSLWKELSKGSAWHGIVKNMRKDGKYYWVDVWVIPKRDEEEKIIGYIASRKVPHHKDVTLVKKEYEKLLFEENCP